MAAVLCRAGKLPLDILWKITTDPKRVQIALILGFPSELPAKAQSLILAWNSLNQQQRRLVLVHAPARVQALLPDYIPVD